MMTMTTQEKQEAMQQAIFTCVMNGGIDHERYLKSQSLTSAEKFILQQEFQWQCAGVVTKRELRRIQNNVIMGNHIKTHPDSPEAI